MMRIAWISRRFSAMKVEGKFERDSQNMPLRAYIRPLVVSASLAAGLAGAGAGLSGCATKPQGYVETKVPQDAPGLRRYADRGDATAANNLGVLYANGNQVPQDFAEAKKWYEFANAHGNPAGAYNLAIAYQRGQGTAVDRQAALKWFREAADHDFAAAKFVLAMLYRSGEGVPKNESESTRLAKSAAVQGLPVAQGFMAAIYADGNGVSSDDSLTYQWASLAAAKLTGPPAMLANKMRDEAAKGLSPAELTAAQAATAVWKPGIEPVSLLPAGSGPRPPRLRGSGSGFIVGKGGEIATDFHVVPACREIRLTDTTGKFTATTQVIADDRANDLAILAGRGFGARLKIRNSPAEIGESISSYGFPLGNLLSSGGNLTTGSVSGTTGMMGDVKSFQITAPVQSGSSGGPVVDESGAVVGIVAAKLNALTIAASTGDLAQNVNFAWRIGLMKTLMDQKGIAYEAAGKSASRSGIDLAGLLQKATVKIACWR
jgi:TPR repeat protein